MSDAALQDALGQLLDANLISQRGSLPESTYSFKHALIQDTAYVSMLRSTRQQVHQEIAQVLETEFPETVEIEPELVAYHALQGEVWDKALVYYRQAGVRAMDQSAHREAVTCYEQALSVIEHLPESRDIQTQALDLRFHLRGALIRLGEYERTFELMLEAATLAEALGDQLGLGRASANMCNYYYNMGQYDKALAPGQRTLSIAEAIGDVGLQRTAHYFLGQVYYALGDYPQAMEVFRWTVASIESQPSGDRGIALRSVAACGHLAWCLAELGCFDEGIVYGEQTVRIAEADGLPFDLVRAYIGIGTLYLRKGALGEATAVLERGLSLCKVREVLIWFPMMASALGSVYTLSGRLDEALPLLEQAVEQSLGGARPGRLVSLSEGYLSAGRHTEASTCAKQALDLSRTGKRRGLQAWTLRLLGDIAMHHEPPEISQVETHYQQSLTLAHELDMRPLQSHCHRGLGKLYSQLGQSEKARSELSTAIEMYRDMDMTYWLPETEAILANVEG